MDLVAKDLYIQKLASRVISQRPDYFENKKQRFGKLKGAEKDQNLSKKKKKRKKRKPNHETQQSKPSVSPGEQRVNTKDTKGSTDVKKDNNAQICFSGVDLLRKRLHQKIEESRGQGAPKDALSPETQAKRARRKLEREKRKQKKKELQMKKLSEENKLETNPTIKQEAEKTPQTATTSKRNETAIVFNKVETVEERFGDKILEKKNKKKRVKGQITALTGKNYKQLLSRMEARKAKLEELREKDAHKAEEMENKIKWTNLLYKAEGVKIKDDEKMLQLALKRKEKKKAQRKKSWNQRSERVVEKMQQRQDKRKRNLQKRKNAKVEKKKNKARKRGRVLPEDLKKAGL